jgi:hypothetical protein
MRNKRGFLLGEETIKLILAVVAIIFLVMFVVYLYNNFSQNKELEQAKSSLAHLTSEITAGSIEVQIYNPKDWGVALFSSKENLPKSCLTAGWNSCICICKIGGTSIHTAKLSCLATNTDITCQNNDFTINPIEGILIANPPITLSIDYQTKTIQQKQ